MSQTEDILSTLRMVKQENLDVRTVTMGINLCGCVDRDAGKTCELIAMTIRSAAQKLKETCATVSARYGIPIVNRRLAVTPIARIADGLDTDGLVRVAKTLDESAEAVQVDLIGGYSALVHAGMTAGAIKLIESLPAVLSTTQRVCASVNAASTKAGINMTAVALLGRKILEISQATADRNGFGCAKLCVFANAPDNNPFMAGGFHGEGSPDTVIHIGVSGPGVVKRALERLHDAAPDCKLNDIAEEIKSTAFRVTRVGELIGREVAERLGVPFGIVDLSLAPAPKMGDSVGEILHLIGLDKLGAPGSTAAVAMLNDAVKKGGLFASSSVGGLSGAFLPVTEDGALAHAAAEGTLTLGKARSHDERLLARARHGSDPRRHRRRHFGRPDGRRIGDRRLQQQNDRHAADPRTREERGRHGLVWRAVRGRPRNANQFDRPKQPLRPPRRPHSRAALESAKLIARRSIANTPGEPPA